MPPANHGWLLANGGWLGKGGNSLDNDDANITGQGYSGYSMVCGSDGELSQRRRLVNVYCAGRAKL